MVRHYFEKFLGKYHRQRGLRLIGRSQFKKAAEHLEKALLYNDSQDNFFYYAVCMIALNMHSKAISYLERIFDDFGDNALVATTLAECYMVVREWEKAELILTALHQKYSENLTIKYLYLTVSDPAERERYSQSKEYFFKAKELLDKKDYEAAITNIKNAIDLNDTNSTYYIFAGMIMMQAGKEKSEVESYFERAVYLSPNNEEYKKQLQYVKTRYR